MKKFSLKKILSRYKMTFGDNVLYVSVDVENKVLTVFFCEDSSYEKLLSVVINVRGHLRDVTDDYTVNVVYGPHSRMISLGNVKSLIV